MTWVERVGLALACIVVGLGLAWLFAVATQEDRR